MARFYGQSKKRGRPPRNSVSRGLWLVIAIFIAGFAVFLLIITKPTKPTPVKQTPPPIASIKKPAPEKVKPKFEFYNILPEKQIASPKTTAKPPAQAPKVVVVPKVPEKSVTPKTIEEPKTETKAVAAPKTAEVKTEETKPQEVKPKEITPTPKAATAKKVPSTYWVQVAAFPEFDEADALKAELAFLGLPASIQTATVNDKKWYRVRSGPFKTEADAKKAQQQFTDADVASKIVAE